MSRTRLAAILFVAVHLVLVAAEFFSPFEPSRQQRQFPNVPPTRPHIIDAEGHLRAPFVYGLTPLGDWAGYREDHSSIYAIHFFRQGRLFTADAGAPFFLLGSDEFGRDQLSRLLHGGRISLAAGVLAALLSIGAGMLLGALSGYRGGGLQIAILRSADLCMALPWLYLLLGARAFLPLSLSPQRTFFLLATIIGLAGWARPATLASAATRIASERDWVRAARSFGAGQWHVLRRHILPELLPVALAQAVILIPRYVLAEVTLSFIGLGIHEPGVSWGLMLSASRQLSVLVSEWWLAIPCVAVAAVFHAYQFAARRLEQAPHRIHWDR